MKYNILIPCLIISSFISTSCSKKKNPEAAISNTSIDVDWNNIPILVDRTERIKEFQSAHVCKSCHPNHFDDWKMSNHAYAAIDPVFLAMNALGQQQSKGKLGQFCVQCHSPTGLATGKTPVNPETFEHDLSKLNETDIQGVTCDVCHSITDVIEHRNAKMVFTPDGNKRASISDPEPTDAHNSVYSPLHKTSEVCAACHAVTSPAGVSVEETFAEWQEYSQKVSDPKTCQGCHMPAYEGTAHNGQNAKTRIVHRHTFVGVDVPLIETFKDWDGIVKPVQGYKEMREMTKKMLQSAAELNANIENQQLVVSIKNLAGHALPSGATLERQMWLEIFVKDANGKIVFETGTFDENGDLRDEHPEHTTKPGSDPFLVKYGQTIYDANGKVATFPWQARSNKDKFVRPATTDTHKFDLSSLGAGKYNISVRLLYRTFPMYFMRTLEQQSAHLPTKLDPAIKTRVPLVEMATKNLEIVL